MQKRMSNTNFIQSSTMRQSNAFTIVELLVVIAIIGILAAITLISYSGITGRAGAVSVQSDLASAATKLKLYYTIYGSYPTLDPSTKCPTAPTVDNNYCLKVTVGNTLTYNLDSIDPTEFALSVRKADIGYSTNNNNLICPLNFIVVPGSTTYGTNDFCVMKYEAKQVGATTTPISQAAGLPWVNISQTTAIANSPNTKNPDGSTCTTCHLITEAEWLTIAQNVLRVASNWSGGVVGSGYIYSGHNDSSPNNAIEASTDDSLGYTGTGNSSGSSPNQKRTLTLTNGEVIWDLSGNVHDWTVGTKTGGQPGVVGNAYASWIQWPNVTTPGTISPSVFPSGTGIAGSSAWTSTNGIGQLLSNPAETAAHAFRRGGYWYDGGYAGVLCLILNGSAGDADANVGFRVAR